MTKRWATDTMTGVQRRVFTAEIAIGPLEVPILDALAAALLVATSLTLLHNQPIAPLQQLALIVAGLLVVLRRSLPLVAVVGLLAATVGVAAGGAGVIDCGEVLPALALVIYTAAAASPRRIALAALLIGGAAMTVEMLQDPAMGAPGLVIFVPFLGVVWAAGRVAWALHLRAVELEQRSAQLARQQAETSRLAAKLERERLGIELHGVVSDGVSAMLAATAGARAGDQSIEAALAIVEQSGRLLLDEMRGVLGVLRRHTSGPERAPQPSLRDLDRLLAEARARGVVVSLRQEGLERPLAAAPDRSAYRIIERALDGTPPAPVDVCVRWREGAVQLEIDTGAEAGWSGLLGAARERTAVCGGHVAATRSAGRIGLRADLPLAGVRA